MAFVRASGGPLRDPWLTLFGVFVIAVWTDANTLHFRVASGARDIPSECPTQGPMVYGWLALPLRLLPRWRGWWVMVPYEDVAAVDRRMALTIARSVVAASSAE